MLVSADLARAAIVEFLSRGYGNHFWDDLVATLNQGPHGCVAAALGTKLPESRWPEAGFYAGRKLRHRYPNGKAAWNARNWAAEVDTILELIRETIEEICGVPEPHYPLALYEPRANPLANGFAGWRHFLQRAPVPRRPGVYILAQFDALPPAIVEPLASEVVYIGYTGRPTRRRTLEQRLQEFEDTAFGGLGHSAGWTYRTELAKDYAGLRNFAGIFASWKAFADDDMVVEDPDTLERRLRAEYRKQWGASPFLNRTG